MVREHEILTRKRLDSKIYKGDSGPSLGKFREILVNRFLPLNQPTIDIKIQLMSILHVRTTLIQGNVLIYLRSLVFARKLLL